jgi:uncharacterized membrane protein
VQSDYGPFSRVPDHNPFDTGFRCADMPVLMSATGGDPGLRSRLRNGFIRGIVLTIPLLLTIVILGFVTNFVFSRLNPLVDVVESVFGLPNIPTYVVQIGVLLGLLGVILIIGLISKEWSGSDQVEGTVDSLIASIPGVGPIYSSFNEMSELLLDSQSQSFQDVKMVEYPTEGSYALAFVTADTPEYIEEGAGHEDMVTLFMPMAPNPVMGGFVVSVDRERVVDLDISVQEGIQAIVTSGVGLGTRAAPPEDGGKLSEYQTDDEATVVNAPDEIRKPADSDQSDT